MKKLTLDLGGGIDLPQLTDEEMKRRLKEITNMTSEEKGLLRDITGKQNSRVINLDILFNQVLADMQSSEEDDDNFIEDIDFSEQFMKFLQWYFAEKETGKFWTKYQENYDILEDIFNRGLENFDEKSVFEYMTPEQKRELRKSFGEFEQSFLDEVEAKSSQEIEVESRFTDFSTSEIDLINLFLNIKEHEGDSWKRFSDYIKNDAIKAFEAAMAQDDFSFDEEQ